MKRVFFLFLIAVAFAWPARAAVELTNLNRGDFIVDPTAAPTNVVILNLPHGGAPDLPGDIISLVNGTNLWEIIGGNLHPKVLNNIVQVTNLISYDVLTANNEFVIQASFSTNLVAGANQLPTWHVGFARLSSDAASTTPADRTVTLQGASGSAQGQLLFLENIWGVLGTQPSAFTLANGSALWGPGTGIVVLQNGDWAPTQNGESLFLQYDGDNWREVARFFGPGGGSGNALINPTVNYLSKRGAATNFVDSLAHDDGSYLYVDGSGTATVELESDDGQIIFGSGGTNVLLRSGIALVYTNNAIDPTIQVKGGGGYTAYFGQQSGGHGYIGSTSGSLYVDDQTLFNGGLYAYGGNRDMGTWSIINWHDIFQNGTHHVIGHLSGVGLTNVSELFIQHTGTNGTDGINFVTVGAGAAGEARDFYFRSNLVSGPIAAKISANSGYAGGGTLFLSDDGTYKAAGGASPWTESPTGTASLVAGVTNIGVLDTVTSHTNFIASSGDVPTWNRVSMLLSTNVMLGSVAPLISPESFVITNNIAYIAGDPMGVSIVNVSDPFSPTVLSSISGFNLFGLAVRGTNLYLPDHAHDRFSIYDITTPSSPSLIGSVTNADFAGSEQVILSGNYALILNQSTSSLLTVDITDPANPTLVNTLTDVPHFGDWRQGVVQGNYLYASASSLSELTVVNIANPLAPSWVVNVSTVYGVYRTAIMGTNIVGAIQDDGSGDYVIGGLAVLSISNPVSPVLTTTFLCSQLAGAEAVAIQDTIAYFTSSPATEPFGSLVAVDLSNPSYPAIVGKYDTGLLFYSEGIVISDSKIYAAGGFLGSGGNGFGIFDLRSLLTSSTTKKPIVQSDGVLALSGPVAVGSTNQWKFGAVKTCSAVTVVLTNYIEIVIDGTTNAIPILNVTP